MQVAQGEGATSVAEELVDEGRDHVNRGRPAAARDCYVAAIDALASLPASTARDRVHGRAELGLGLVETDLTGDFAAGIRHVEVAESILPTDADDLLVALLGQRAVMCMRAGRLEDALVAFVRAEAVLPRTTASHRASMLLNRGLLRVELGKTAEARVDLQRAVAEAAAAEQPRTAYKARHNLALAAFVEGDLPGAIEGMAAAPMHGDGTRESVDPITLMDRGRVLLEAGLVREADDLLAQAQGHFRREERGRDLGEVALVRAEVALVAGELDRSAEFARRAVADFTAGGNDRWRRRAELVEASVTQRRLVDVVWSSGEAHTSPDVVKVRQLRAQLLALATHATDDPDVAVGARLVAVELSCALGDAALATREFTAVDLPNGASLRLRLRWHLSRALVAAINDDPDAYAAVETGVAELTEAQELVGSRDLRTALALHGRPLVQVGIRTALRRNSLDELHRAVDLAHAASSRLTPVRSALDDEERGLLSELRSLEDRRWREVDAPEDAREEWGRRANLLRGQLRARAWRRGGQDRRGADPVVSLEAFRAGLADVGAVGVSFFRQADELCALRVTPVGVRIVRIGRLEDVLGLVSRLRADLAVLHMSSVTAAMRDVVAASLQHQLADLDRLVVDPLQAQGRGLLVVPHGALALMPWSLLPSRRGAGTVTTPSVTRWVRQRSVSATSAGDWRVAALAGPDLARAQEEVADVREVWGLDAGTALASARDVRAAFARADLVHLAAHGVHRASAPLFSSVRLADGPLYAHELAETTRSRLVVLSACDVGSNAMRPGDEPMGFAAALLETGAGAVIGSVAPIRDDVAAVAGRDLHRHLAAGSSPAAAVARVVAEASDAGHAAPLIVLGNGFRALDAPGNPVPVPPDVRRAHDPSVRVSGGPAAPPHG